MISIGLGGWQKEIKLMENAILPQIAYGIGAICLGVILTLGTFLSAGNTRKEEGCLIAAISLPFLFVAIMCFAVAVNAG